MEVSKHMETSLQPQKNTVHSEQENMSVGTNKLSSRKSFQAAFGHATREILEVVLALSIVSIVGMVSISIWVPSHIIFCAFFLVVFIIAMRYHRVTAYVAAILAAGSYSILLSKSTQLHPSFAVLHMLIEPFLLLILGMFVSEMLYSQRHRLQIAEQEQLRKEELLQEMKQSYEVLSIQNMGLESRRDGQTRSNDSISEKMLRLWEFRGQEQYDAILDIVMQAVGAETCMLYMLRKGHMTLCASQQKVISEYAKTARLELDVNESLIRRTLERRQVCTIRDLLAHEQTTHRAITLMSGPIVDCDNQIIGVVVVDNIPLLKFSPTTVRLFGSILHMTSIALQTTTAADANMRLPDTDEIQTVPLQSDDFEDELIMQASTELGLPAVRNRLFRKKSTR